MSSDFYFRTWRNILSRLTMITSTDLDYQDSKVHDKTLCEAVYRLTSILGQYLAVYKHVVECVQLNLQVQKTSYLEDVCRALIGRITELKSQLKKLEATEYNFFGHALIQNRLTTVDIEIDDVYPKPERSEDAQEMIEEVFRREDESQRLIEEEKALEAKNIFKGPDECWWDEEDKDKEDSIITFHEKKEILTEEQLEIRKFVTLIQTQERTRQVVLFITMQRNKREKWTKELEGRMPPPAPLEVREKSARLIQKILRNYFEIKRQRIIDCKRDELLDLIICFKSKTMQMDNVENIKQLRYKRKIKYSEERDAEYEKIKQKLLKYRRDDIIEHYRDYTRDWFRLWFDEIQFINDIPDDKEGGLEPILNGETPNPTDWLEEYKKHIADKKSNKSATELKFQKKEAKRLLLIEKKDQAMKEKLEQQLLRKMMKNPNLHPGYEYPQSNKIHELIKAIEKYHEIWHDLDETEYDNVKKRFIKGFDDDNACSDVKRSLTKNACEDMREELKVLKKALKIDYENNGETMPEVIKKKKKKEKKERKIRKEPSGNLMEKVEDLVSRGILKKYDKTKLKDIMGDPNFAGDDIKCDYREADPFYGEIKQIWWERCREMVRGFQKVLLVGPRLSGKTVLMQALASINDAILFELDPMKIPVENINAEYLDPLVNSMCTCAKALQPSVIYIRQIEKLFYRKKPPQEIEINFKLLKKYFTTKLFKKLNKSDNITVIGACTDPWVMKSKQILKQFPTVVMMPKTSYSIVFELLRHWVFSNHTLPPDFDVGSLAYVLTRFSIGYIKQALEDFLTAERVVKIRAYGLSPMEIYSFILDNESEEQVDYTKYKKWYTDNTINGQKEKKHFKQQADFKRALDLFKERSKKNKSKSAPSSAASSIK